MKTASRRNRFHAVAPDGAINWEHPLARGLVGHWAVVPGMPAAGSRLLNLAGRTNHGTLTNQTASAPMWQPGGKAVRFAATTQYVKTGANSALFPSATAASVLLFHRKLDTTLRASTAFGVDTATGNGNTDRAGSHCPYSDGTVYWDWGGSANGSSRLTYAGRTWDTMPHVWAFTVGNGMRIYLDGVQVASNAAVPSHTGTSAVWEINQGNAVTGGDLVDVYQVFVWKVTLSAGSVRLATAEAMAGNPNLYRWLSTRYYAPAAAPAGNNLLLKRRRMAA